MKNKGKRKFVERSDTKTKMRKKMIGNFFRGVIPKKNDRKLFSRSDAKKNDRKLFFPSQTKKRMVHK